MLRAWGRAGGDRRWSGTIKFDSLGEMAVCGLDERWTKVRRGRNALQSSMPRDYKDLRLPIRSQRARVATSRNSNCSLRHLDSLASTGNEPHSHLSGGRTDFELTRVEEEKIFSKTNGD